MGFLETVHFCPPLFVYFGKFPNLQTALSRYFSKDSNRKSLFCELHFVVVKGLHKPSFDVAMPGDPEYLITIGVECS